MGTDLSEAIEVSHSSRTSEPPFYTPAVGSLCFIIFNFVFWLVCRYLMMVFLPRKYQLYLLSFVAVMEESSYHFEYILIMKHYGPGFYFSVIVVVEIIVQKTTLGGYSNPIEVLNDYYEMKLEWNQTVALVFVQTISGLLSYRFALLIWSSWMTADHQHNWLFKDFECQTCLHVSVFVGMLIESSSSAFIIMVKNCKDQDVADPGNDRRLWTSPFVKNVMTISVIAALNTANYSTTGGYFNPAQATGHLWGCQGHDHSDFFLVYWLAPILGVFANV